MMRHANFPFMRMLCAACLYRSRMSLPGSPARSDSSSPALVTIGIIPSRLQQSSSWKDLPWPLPPQIPIISGGRMFPRLPWSARTFFTACIAMASRYLGATYLRSGQRGRNQQQHQGGQCQRKWDEATTGTSARARGARSG